MGLYEDDMDEAIKIFGSVSAESAVEDHIDGEILDGADGVDEFKLTARRFIIARRLREESNGGFMYYVSSRFGPNAKRSVREWTEIMNEWNARPADMPVEEV